MKFKIGGLLMKQWKKWALTATCLVGLVTTVPAVNAVSLSANINGKAVAQKVIGGTANLPSNVTVSRLSNSMLIPGYLDLVEKTAIEETGKAIQNKDFKLGEAVDAYQWQLKDKKSLKTANVFTMELTQENTKGFSALLNPTFVKAQLPMINAMWLQSEQQINTFLQGALTKGITNSPSLNMTVDMADQTPWTELKGTQYPTYIADTRLFINAQGVEMPFYVQGAMILKQPNPVAYVMITSDVERKAFAPVFEKYIKSFK